MQYKIIRFRKERHGRDTSVHSDSCISFYGLENMVAMSERCFRIGISRDPIVQRAVRMESMG